MRAVLRKQYPAKTIMQLAAEYDLGKDAVHHALAGLSHARRHLYDDEVMEMRAAYPQLTIRQIAKKWGYTRKIVHDAITGRARRFAHLHGAHSGDNRRGWASGGGKKHRKVNVTVTLALHASRNIATMEGDSYPPLVHHHSTKR